MTEKRLFGLTKDSLIAKKTLRFQTAQSVEQCLAILREMDGKTLKGFTVSVHIEEEHTVQDGKLTFRMESRYGFVKGRLSGAIQDESGTVITGAAGIDLTVLMVLAVIVSAMPFAYTSLSTRTPQDIVGILVFGGLAAAAVLYGGVTVRNALISGLQARVLQENKQ